MKRRSPLRICTLSLGCVKNLVDTETFLGRIAQSGCVLVPDVREADLVLVNTCSFIKPALNESLKTLRELVSLKGPKVVAVGCMVQHLGKKLFELVPGLWGAVGLDEERKLPDILNELLQKKRIFERPGPARGPAAADTGRLRLTPRHYAYLKISEGCSDACTFCTIPRIRGPLRSKPLSTVLREAREMVRSGAHELILIAQDLTAYGTDRRGAARLPELLLELQKIRDLFWIRLLYLHPAKLTEDLIGVIAGSEKILACLDLPFQHASTPVLKAMGRGMDTRRAEELLHHLRRRLPPVVFRGTFLVGFPGETEEDFNILLDFARRWEFPRGGVFRYSPQEGTKAARLGGRVPPALARKRQAALRRVLVENARKFAESRVGRKVTVVVDEIREGRPVGRTFAEAPDVDPVVWLPPGSAQVGDFLEGTVRGVRGLDLTVEPD